MFPDARPHLPFFFLMTVSKRGKYAKIRTILYFRFCWRNNNGAWKLMELRFYGRNNATVWRDVARNFCPFTESYGSRDSSVGIATSYGLDDRGVGVRVPVGSRIFSSPRRPDRLWVPPNLLSSGYRGLFHRGWSGRGVKLTTHLQLVLRSRKCGSIHPLPYTPSWRGA
jgi:hypothetical protein